MKTFHKRVVLGIVMMLMAFTVSLGSIPNTVEAQSAPFRIEFVGWSNKNWADAFHSATKNMDDFARRNSLTCGISYDENNRPRWRSIGPEDNDYNPAYLYNGKLTAGCVYTPLP